LVSSRPELIELTRPKLTRFIPHSPTERQAAFLCLAVKEAFYGGAAGGGKSDALLMGALQYVDHPDYNAILFRRTLADLTLPGALMDRAASWLTGTGAVWRDRAKTWEFPSGATLTFGYLEHEGDKYRYQGADFQFIGFDELTHFTETQYRYLFSRARRRAGSRVPIRVRAASNPGGVGHEWVKQRFLVEGPAKGRVFVPAKLADNPHLDQEEYVKALSELDPVTLAQLLEGAWDVKPEGKKFKREWFKVVTSTPTLRVCRFWDMAATEPAEGKDPDWTAGALCGASDAGDFYILDLVRFRCSPGEVEARIKATAHRDGRGVPVHMEQEPGSSGKFVVDYFGRKVLPGFTFYGHKATGDKEVRANPVSSAAFNGRVYILAGPWVLDFLDEAASFPTKGVHDDQVDAVSGAFEQLFPGGIAATEIVLAGGAAGGGLVDPAPDPWRQDDDFLAY
jgi:predicted phage terminase large subunit-like protein